MATIGPAIFVNHGGGPRPLLRTPDHAELIEFLENGVKKMINLRKIKAIILVTAHWEADVVTISSNQHHDLYHDYDNFPPEAYQYKYNAPGHPELAARIHEKLTESGIKSKLDPDRGWDHGLFVPMMLINPSADIPIVQMSVTTSQDPKAHYQLGLALQDFRREGVAIIGSGMSYHDLKEIKSGTYEGDVVNVEFDKCLTEVCTAEDENVRREGLLAWRDMPEAFMAHLLDAADHFMPLIVIAGAGGPKQGERVFNWDMFGKFRLSGFLWKDL